MKFTYRLYAWYTVLDLQTSSTLHRLIREDKYLQLEINIALLHCAGLALRSELAIRNL
jgi:hypothetical protein